MVITFSHILKAIRQQEITRLIIDAMDYINRSDCSPFLHIL